MSTGDADRADLEQGSGENVPLDNFDESRSETFDGHSDYSAYRDHGEETMGESSSGGPFYAGSRQQRKDFDDGANSLWSLYGNVAKTHDQARFSSLAEDMDAVGVFAGLFSGVLASFLVQSIPNLQVNPADQSVYYQNQSAYYQQQSAYYLQQSAYYQQQSFAMLAQVSQQIASVALHVSIPSIASPSPPTAPQSSVSSTIQQVFIPSTIQQVSIPSTSPPPYPAFKPASSDVRVNAFWVISLVCVLSAALLAILVKQWVRSYMQVFERYDHPLKRARFRQFFFEGAHGMRKLAEAVPRLIHLSLFLFFVGLGDYMLQTHTAAGITTIVPICICGLIYLYSILAHLRDLQSPYKTMISSPIFFLRRNFPRHYSGGRFLRKQYKPTTIEGYQEELVMEETPKRKERDVRAVRWLVDTTTVNAEMEPLVVAIPGAFNTEWGREVWRHVAYQGRPDPDTLESGTVPASLVHRSLRPPEGTAADTICRCVSYLFETCNNHSYFENEEARRRRMRACVEAVASLVCCIDFRLEWFGEVGKLVSEIGDIEQINQSSSTASDPSFIVRWTCLSLVAVQQILSSNRLQVLADYAVSGLARSEYGRPDVAGWRGAQKIEECLKTAWENVEELRQAFEPLAEKKTTEQVEEILRIHERQISALERIKVEAEAMEDVDWRISLYQDAKDEVTHRLTRQLPGVSFDKRHRSDSFSISDTFITPTTGSAPVTPQLIFPGQQVQALARLGSKLREVLDNQDDDGHKEALESLKSVDQVPVSLRRPDGLMKRQLWRLQDLRDGAGLGYTVELFLLSLRHLLSIPSLHESSSVVYEGTFKIITSHWEKSKGSLGTQHILLNIICDLIIKGRGVFSDFKYPEPITTKLLETVEDILQGYVGGDEPVRDAVHEIASVDSRTCMDMELQRKALAHLSQHIAGFVQ